MRWWQGWLHRHDVVQPEPVDLHPLTLPGRPVLYMGEEMRVIERDYRHANGEITIRLRPVRARRAG